MTKSEINKFREILEANASSFMEGSCHSDVRTLPDGWCLVC